MINILLNVVTVDSIGKVIDALNIYLLSTFRSYGKLSFLPKLVLPMGDLSLLILMTV